MYNLSNLEPKFKLFLYAEKVSAVTLRNYLSDFRHFSGWLLTSGSNQKDKPVNSNNTGIPDGRIVEEYKQHHILSQLPVKTTNRRLSALRKFYAFCQKEGLMSDNPAKGISNLGHKNVASKFQLPQVIINRKIKEYPANLAQQEAKSTKSAFELNVNKYILSVGCLLIFLLLTLLIKSKNLQNSIPPAVQAKTSANRYLAFSGKLLDSLGNPITTKTDVTFNLYRQRHGGRPIYTASCRGEKAAITPDVSGNTNVLLGADCDGKPLPAEIFTNNQNLYLGVTIGSDTEMLPRQNIPNVGYAQNANAIQGLNIGDTNLSVPYINQDGDLLIGTSNSAIRSTHESANFTISSAETTTIESAKAGDVVLQATESGGLKLRTGGFTDSYTRLTINNEGNIGVGTLFPTYGLEVNDDIKITNGNRLILASASVDPSGENGAMYYNIQSNKFRCFQAGHWIDCFAADINNSVGGIYDGKLENDTIISGLEKDILKLNDKISQLENELRKLNSLTLERITPLVNPNYLLTQAGDLITNKLSVREEIFSPVVESNEIKSSVISPKYENLTIDLSRNTQAYTSDVKSEDPGPLASLIIRGLEGKTVTTLDAAGNASFSGQLTAENLLIANNATISGSLYANNIESENLNKLIQDLSSTQNELSRIKSENINNVENKIASLSGNFTELDSANNETVQKWNNDLNEIQKLLAEIKNQPLPDPQYYQNLNDLDSDHPKLIDDLTVSGKSNFYDAAVSNSLNVGNLLFQDNSILSLAWDLKLSALGDIKLFDDGVVIGKDGTIRAKGQLIAGAGVITHKIEAPNSGQPVEIDNLALQDLLITNKYLDSTDSASIIASDENFAQNGLSTPSIETQTAIAGVGVIPRQSQEIIIYNSKVKDSSLIYLTPTDQITTSNLTVSKKEACSNSSQSSVVSNQQNELTDNRKLTTYNCRPYFKVSSSLPTQSNLSFNWLILN